MADLVIEFVSEEIPARMQAGAGRDLARLIETALTTLGVWHDDSVATGLCAPRHLLAYVTNIAASQPDRIIEKRGPRVDAPEAAIAGFLNSAGVSREDLVEEDTPKGRFLFARSEITGGDTAALLAPIIIDILTHFPWPKSQRWGRGKFRWVRPLHRINILFDGKPLAGSLDLGGGDVINFGAASCGHYFEAPDDIDLTGVTGLDDVQARLRAGYVMLDQDERHDAIIKDAKKLAASRSCHLNETQLGGYLADIAGLVEWPTPLMGQIEDRFMVLPPELLQATIATHQKYITLSDADGKFSSNFIVLSNRLGDAVRDKVIIAGNQRVLRARLADAEFFWQQDQARQLETYLPALGDVTFYEGLGSIHDKAIRMKKLASAIAPQMPSANLKAASRAARLAKADLVTGMVGEFPELQGIMGGYYAAASGEDKAVCDAITAHYRPQGPADDLPATPEAMVVALADKIDTLVGFFGIDAKPTGSKDPFALRRAALGVIRIIVDGQLAIPLGKILQVAASGYGFVEVDADLLPFIRDRLRGYLRDQKMRHDVVAAALADDDGDDICLMAARASALAGFLAAADGAGLMASWRRVSSILAAEEKKAKTAFAATSDPALFTEAEKALFDPLSTMAVNQDNIELQLAALGALRSPIDLFFEKIVVNDDDPAIRLNRLGLLAMIREKMLAVADFTKIEG
ncbi:MAG: glycine--tRNA ligase subunit beta [Alphaproteobacteria bacterium]|nr:glycine--tRNA ligase subunit beta [Alphaproteobacteria bacterium]